MTEAERADLIDLYIAGELPEALRDRVEMDIAAHPDAAGEVAALQATARRLQSLTHEKPDAWFVERALDRLLREHYAASETEIYIHNR